MSDPRLRRSVLYVPGSNERAMEKAKGLNADCLILDLEDPVAPEVKQTARGLVADVVTAGGYGTREVVVRINSLSTEWGHADVRAIARVGADSLLNSEGRKPSGPRRRAVGPRGS